MTHEGRDVTEVTVLPCTVITLDVENKLKQQCYIAMIYLNWLVLAGGLVYFLVKGLDGLAVTWVVVLPLAMWGYIRVFPSISQAMGSGKIEDRPARTNQKATADVTLYTALGCPFCPVVKQRLAALSESMGFRLKEIDVTLKPGMLGAKGIRAVPVVEAGGKQLSGNATSEELAQFILGNA